MDIFGGLSLVGTQIHKKNNKEKEKEFPSKIKKINRVGDNIYYSNEINNGMEHIRKKSKEYTKKANNPTSGIIPAYYNRRQKNIKKKIEINDDNSDSMFSDASSNCSVNNDSNYDLEPDHTTLMKKCEKFGNNEKSEKKILNNNNVSTYMNQFEELQFDNKTNPVASNVTNNTDLTKMEIERKLALTGGYSSFENNDMTYGITNSDNFVHNNMVPFISSAAKGYGNNQMAENQIGEYKKRKLDLFSGSANNLDYRPKTERRPLFNPLVGLTNINGMPNVSEFMESRYEPGIEKRNEKPFQPIKVTPGLNLGYDEISKHGEQDPFRMLPKTVDELRTISNPKNTYTTPIISGQKGTRRPIEPTVIKRRPSTFFELDLPENKKSYYNAPKVQDNYDIAFTNRDQTSTEYFGGAKSERDALLPEHRREIVQVTNKEHFLADSPTNVTMVDAKNARDNTKYDPRITNRTIYNKTNYVGPANNNENQKGHAFDMILNVPDQTNREMFSNTKQHGGVNNTQLNKGHAYDMISNIPDNTERSIHNQYDRSGHMGNAEYNKGHAYDMVSNIPDNTKRNINDQHERTGHMGNAAFSKGHAFDMILGMPDITQRNIYNQYDRNGHIGNTEIGKGYAFDMETNAPDNTQRSIFNQFDRNGQVGNGEQNKGYVYDMETNAPDNTQRSIFNQFDRNGQVGNGEHNKGYVYDQETNIPDATKRDIYNKFDRNGQVGNGEQNKGYVYDMETNAPDNTQRSIFNQFDRNGQVGNGEHNKGYVYDQETNIPDATKRDIYNQFDRNGQVGNGEHNKGYVYDQETNIPDATKRDIYNRFDRNGHVGTGEHHKGHVYDMETNIPDVTKRDIYNKTDRNGYVGTGEHHKGHAYDMYTNIPNATNRDIYNKTERSGHMGNGQFNKNIAFDYINSIPDATHRSINDKTERSGHIGNFQFSKGVAFDMETNIPEITMRNITEKTERAGHLGNAQYSKEQVFDKLNAIPDLNFRNIHEDKDRAGFIGNQHYNKTYVLDEKNAIPDVTNRELYCKLDRAGHIGNAVNKNNYVLDKKNATPQQTMRDIHGENKYIGPVGYHDKQRSQNDYRNALMKNTLQNEFSKHMPTKSNYNKGPINISVTELKEQIQINRELYPDMHWNSEIRVEPGVSSNCKTLPQNSNHFLSFTKDNLKYNPYINNTQHKANPFINKIDTPESIINGGKNSNPYIHK
jgi:ABC-type molybdate transport system substrate-binding protein